METGHRVRLAIFLTVAAVMLLGVVSAPMALVAGAALALTLGTPDPDRVRRASSLLLKICVVGLGFGLSLDTVFSAGARGVWITGLAVLAMLASGVMLSRVFGVQHDSGRLITTGTAICGGSAIAAVAPVIRASPTAVSTALACVFLLNAVALLLFPWLGRKLELSESQFALWAAVAIHDTAGVVGAAASYGEQALAEATVLKLVRTLWLVPVVIGFVLLTSADEGSKRRPAWPLFILFFVLAVTARSILPSLAPMFDFVADGARRGLSLVLFLIGSGLTLDLLRQVGWRPLGFALSLWLLVSAITLALVLNFTS